MLDPSLAASLNSYERAPTAQRKTWIKSYSAALATARVDQGQVVLPPGQYGPVAPLMEAMLNFTRAGLLDGALTQDINPKLAPYNTSYDRALLYLDGPIIDRVADHLDERGSQWGMTHSGGPYPGAWWLWPYALLYQIPAIANSPNADLIAGMIVFGVTLVLIFLPIIPGLNRIPYRIPIYRIIWRDWYQKYPSGVPSDALAPPETAKSKIQQPPALSHQVRWRGAQER
jgi:hypothetical protein